MINTTETAKYYAAFYFAAFVIAFIVKLIEGKRRNFPWITWISLTLFTQVLFIIGTKAITFSWNDWLNIIHTFELPATLQRSVLGGLLSFIIVYLVARYFLKFRNDFLDAITIPSLIGLSVQRIGCFMGGCCFGTPTHVPWAVNYDNQSPAFISQLNSGLVNDFCSHSLAIHPTQLYYAVSGIVTVILLLILKKKIRAAGNLFILSLSIFAFSRFVIEFFVDVQGNQIGSNMVLGLKIVQWVLVCMSIIIFSLFLYRENNFKTASNTRLAENFPKSILLLFISFIIIFYCKNWFSIMELHLLKAMLLFTFALIAIKIYATYHKPLLRMVHFTVALSMLVLMSQTLDTTGRDSIQFIRFNSLGIEQSLGKYQNSSHEICNNTYYKHNIAIANINYSNTRTRVDKPYRWREMGIKMYVGIDNVQSFDNYNHDYNTMYTSKMVTNQMNIGLNPYLKYNYKYIGFSTGLLISSYANFPLFDVPVIPQLNLRLGPEDLIYVKGDLFPSSITGVELPILSTSIGSGLGAYNNNYVELGYGISDFSDNVVLLSGSFLYSDKIKIRPSIIYGNDNNTVFSMGLVYRFDK
jgi:prolipoprotein diacylglyceryltransferase